MMSLRIALLTFLVALTLFPAFVSAAAGDRKSGLVVCGNSSTGTVVSDEDMCKYADLIEEVRVILNFLMFNVAAPLAAIMFAYAGILLVTNGGNESRVTQAKEIFWNVFIGLVVALAAWLTVNLILTFLLGDGSAFNLLGGG